MLYISKNSLYYTVALYIWDHGVWGFLPNNITQKPASHFLYKSLSILVMHSQALQINPKPFQQVAMKFLFN